MVLLFCFPQDPSSETAPVAVATTDAVSEAETGMVLETFAETETGRVTSAEDVDDVFEVTEADVEDALVAGLLTELLTELLIDTVE